MLLTDATLATLDPPHVERGCLRIDGELVLQRAPQLQPGPGEEVVPLDGALVLPGLVNAHTHLYSTLARGMPGPETRPRNFIDMLEQVWWRLDRALDAEAVRLSALAGAIEAARCGTTVLIDHHASPSCVRGSLDVLRCAVEQVGLRSVLCYETTDRHGPQSRDLGLQENAAFLAAGPTPLTAGVVGAHASFTLGDDSLAALAGTVARARSRLHVHAAEDRADVDDARWRRAGGVVDRLRRHGLLDRALLAHGVHLSHEELAVAHGAGAWLLHCPRSNMNNAVGQARTSAFGRAALGTDGIDEDVLAEARAAFLKMREAGRDDAASAAIAMLAGGQRLASELLGVPLGRCEGGAPADLVVLDYRPPTPLTAANLSAHLLFGVDRSHVRSTIVAGRFVMRDRRILTVDETDVLERARLAAVRVWERMRRL